MVYLDHEIVVLSVIGPLCGLEPLVPLRHRHVQLIKVSLVLDGTVHFGCRCSRAPSVDIDARSVPNWLCTKKAGGAEVVLTHGHCKQKQLRTEKALVNTLKFINAPAVKNPWSDAFVQLIFNNVARFLRQLRGQIDLD